jgi:hypothetical protein
VSDALTVLAVLAAFVAEAALIIWAGTRRRR